MRKKGVVRKCCFLKFSLKCSILEILRNAGFMAFHNRIVENRNEFLTQLKRQRIIGIVPFPVLRKLYPVSRYIDKTAVR